MVALTVLYLIGGFITTVLVVFQLNRSHGCYYRGWVDNCYYTTVLIFCLFLWPAVVIICCVVYIFGNIIRVCSTKLYEYTKSRKKRGY